MSKLSNVSGLKMFLYHNHQLLNVIIIRMFQRFALSRGCWRQSLTTELKSLRQAVKCAEQEKLRQTLFVIVRKAIPALRLSEKLGTLIAYDILRTREIGSNTFCNCTEGYPCYSVEWEVRHVDCVCVIRNKCVTGQNIPGQIIPDTIYPDRTYPDKICRTKDTRQTVPG